MRRSFSSRAAIGGGIGWVSSMTLLGYILGQVPWVQANLEKAVLIVIALSISPMFIHYIQNRRKKRAKSDLPPDPASSFDLRGISPTQGPPP